MTGTTRSGATGATDSAEGDRPIRRHRGWLIGVAAVRVVIGVVAVPLAPVLWEEHFVLLVLLRPTKEVLLAGGFLAHEGDVGALPVVAAALPLSILGVWHFYALGRAYCRELVDADLPGVAGRLLPPRRIARLRDVLANEGRGVILLGRLSVFPSSLLAAAAGSSDMRGRDFMPVDVLGASLSIVESFGLGLLLGAAYDDAGPWLTAVGVVFFLALALLFRHRMLDADPQPLSPSIARTAV